MWMFHGMAAFSVMILRRRYPERARPYRMWGYPVTPMLFVLFALWFVINTLLTRPASSSASAGIMAAGLAAYFVWKRQGASMSSGESIKSTHH
jgi:basic amino acid/polyamine antiporter, APA family